MSAEEIIIDLQEQIFTNKGIRTDVYRYEGQVAHFVPEGAEIAPQNILVSIPEHVIAFGEKVTINFQGGN